MLLNIHHRTTKKTHFSWLLLGLFLFMSRMMAGQEQISGVINNYSKVIGVGDCPGSILVQDPSVFFVGQRVLLIGMQGGNMLSDNTSDFGTVLSQDLTAGLYDWSEIESINGQEITLAHAISAGYDFNAAVQLVGIPTYEEAIVVEKLIPQAWNGQTGGVVALEVSGTLSLEADIDATGRGFRGGTAVLVNSNCTFLTNISDYSFESGNWRGAAKGEGIIPFVVDKENGRGPQANGGGGGNDHNSGGGGGGNTSSGGKGGENREPSTFGCDGKFPGLGGRDLDAFTLRWFMGGGGGAGHSNNTEEKSDGGNGGGIILIKCDELVFAGGTIQADGINGSEGGGDGGGGGGGGGTIILEVGSISGEAMVYARGGKGGDANNFKADRCLGPGGGGGGGQVYSTVAITPQLNGGGAGLSMDSDACPEGPNGATAGTNGSFLALGIKAPNEKGTPAVQLFSSDTLICPGNSFALFAGIEGGEVGSFNYQWSADSGNGWMVLQDGPIYSGSQSLQLQVSSQLQEVNYQLTVSDLCGTEVMSEVIQVSVDPAGAMPTAAFTYQVDELMVNINNTTIGADTYEWEVREWPEFNSSESEPSITFPGAGTYELILTAYSNCGVDSSSQIITLGGAPVALFSGELVGNSCVPVTIQWTDASKGQFDTYQWYFPGGTPAESSEPNPEVTYYKAGVYDVRLTVSGPLGESTLTQTEIVKVFALPQPSFSYQVSDLTVSFFTTTDTLAQHSWTFGDGNSSLELKPVHTFAEAGAYDVTLNVLKGGCAQSVTQTVLVFPSALEGNDLPVEIGWYPNPTRGYLQLKGGDPGLYPLELYLFSGNGQLIRRMSLHQASGIDIGTYPNGIYWILIDSALGKGSWKILKQ